MALTVGRKLGAYEILASMGETRSRRHAGRSVLGFWRHCLLTLLSAGISVGAVLAQQLPHRLIDGLPDLRTEAVLTADHEAHARGRALLEAAAKRQGYDAWLEHETFEVIGLDRWRRILWWPQSEQRLRVQLLTGTFTSRVELLDGPAAGEYWGIQSWAPYRQKAAGSEVEFLDEPNGTHEFYLPTLHYLAELPFRLLEASVVIDAGPASVDGTEYHRVFASWGTPEPNEKVDQYVVWIGRRSGLVEKAHFTLRDFPAYRPVEQRAALVASSVSTIHYEDFREIDGVAVPFVYTITRFGPEQAKTPLDQEFLHRFEADSARFDAFDRTLLIPDSSRSAPADAKPAQ